MAASLVVVGLELSKLAFQVAGIPEQYLVEKFSAHGSDQALDERVRQRHVGDGFDFVDLQNPQVRHPPVRLEHRIVIRTEMSRYALPVNHGVKHAADLG